MSGTPLKERFFQAVMLFEDMIVRSGHIVPSDDKKRGRLNCISHLLSEFSYEAIPFEAPEIPKRNTKHEYDDQASLAGRNFVLEKY